VCQLPYACNFHKIGCGFAQKLVLNAKFSKNFDWQKFNAVVFREIRSVFDTGKNLASILQASLRERGANILQQASFAEYSWLAGHIAALYRENSASVWYWPEFWQAICKRLCRKSMQIWFATLYRQIFPSQPQGVSGPFCMKVAHIGPVSSSLQVGKKCFCKTWRGNCKIFANLLEF